MGLSARLGKVVKALAGRPAPGVFDVIEAVPVGRAPAEGRPPGLYRDGPVGSRAGVLVYDPADGEPVVPAGRLAPWGLLVVCGPEYVPPPLDGPEGDARQP